VKKFLLTLLFGLTMIIDQGPEGGSWFFENAAKGNLYIFIGPKVVTLDFDGEFIGTADRWVFEWQLKNMLE